MSNMKKMFSVGVSLFNVQNLNNDELKTHIHERYKMFSNMKILIVIY